MKTYENALRHYNNCQAPTKRAKKWLRMPDNAVELFAMPDIDGGLIGGASLNPQDFLAICQA